MKNRRIRKALFDADMKQYQLAELLGVSESWVSTMLSNELSASEQKKIVELIKEEAKKKDEARQNH